MVVSEEDTHLLILEGGGQLTETMVSQLGSCAIEEVLSNKCCNCITTYNMDMYAVETAGHLYLLNNIIEVNFKLFKSITLH